MEWVIYFIASWILFILLVDFKQLKTTIWSGLVTVPMQLYIDFQGTNYQLYYTKNNVIDLFGSSAFFTFGPVLIISILISQYLPKRRAMKICNIIVLTAIYILMEVLLVSRGVVVYLKWSLLDSILLNIAVISIICWFSMIVLGKKEVLD